ncbi:MAG TPA: C40 family peptidase [Candidatus Sulfotelmatobacter sp.]|nr:C40 family peptidase [Candidatus Sulfotelmatobacter sp.]
MPMSASQRGNRTFYRAAWLLFLLSAACAFAKNGLQIVVVPVANMYSHPSDKSDVVSQAIYGSNVKLLVARGEWSQIQTPDRYKGWVPSRQLRVILTGDGYATAGPTVQVESLFANIYNEPDITKQKPVITVPFETKLEVAAPEADDGKTPQKPAPEGWLEVRLPVMRRAWIQTGDVISDPKPLSIPESIELAKRFLGIPYLWGGRSSFGFDCSGFTQMLVRARGIVMPRDADQQAAWRGAVAVERKDLEPGDLLFFGASAKQITHTGMYIGDGQFINATTNGHPVVQISRLDDQPWTKALVACRRVKPQN